VFDLNHLRVARDCLAETTVFLVVVDRRGSRHRPRSVLSRPHNNQNDNFPIRKQVVMMAFLFSWACHHGTAPVLTALGPKIWVPTLSPTFNDSQQVSTMDTSHGAGANDTHGRHYVSSPLAKKREGPCKKIHCTAY
jgi:hypothetical protein